MSTPLVAQVFKSVTNAELTSSWEDLVHQTLSEIAAKEVMDITAAAQASTPSVDPKTPITDIGDFLTKFAFVFHCLAEKLVCESHVEMAVVKVHEQAWQESHVSELAPLLAMDLEIQKLYQIRDLIETFYRDVKGIWLPVPPASSDSPIQQNALSSCDGDPTPLTRLSVAIKEFKSNGSGTRVHRLDHAVLLAAQALPKKRKVVHEM